MQHIKNILERLLKEIGLVRFVVDNKIV